MHSSRRRKFRKFGEELLEVPTVMVGQCAVGEEKPETTATAIASSVPAMEMATRAGDTAPVAELGNCPSSEQADSPHI
jgi:hypothetical protein